MAVCLGLSGGPPSETLGTGPGSPRTWCEARNHVSPTLCPWRDHQTSGSLCPGLYDVHGVGRPTAQGWHGCLPSTATVRIILTVLEVSVGMVCLVIETLLFNKILILFIYLIFLLTCKILLPQIFIVYYYICFFSLFQIAKLHFFCFLIFLNFLFF